MYTFDVSEVRDNVGDTDYERFTTAAFNDDEGHNQWHPIVSYIVSMSMVCGFNSITEKNVHEVWGRIVDFEFVNDSESLMFPPEYKPEGHTAKITLDDLRVLIGFRCNASTMTKAQWNKKLMLILRERIETEKKARTLSMEAGDTLYNTYDAFARNVAADTGKEIVNGS